MRGHANAIETIPMALILLLLLALLGVPAWAIHLLGIALTVGRVLHALHFNRRRRAGLAARRRRRAVGLRADRGRLRGHRGGPRCPLAAPHDLPPTNRRRRRPPPAGCAHARRRLGVVRARRGGWSAALRPGSSRPRRCRRACWSGMTAPRVPIAGLMLDRPRLMGILNVTPDSFSDGGDLDRPGAPRVPARCHGPCGRPRRGRRIDPPRRRAGGAG